MPDEKESTADIKKPARRGPKRRKEETVPDAAPWQEATNPDVEHGIMIIFAGLEYKLPMQERELNSAWVSLKQKIPRGVAVEIQKYMFIGPLVAKRY
tara:strand:- start:1691 stop:1981 length:291 start_codon:yes stop_codon:yes gene_type:complete